MRILELRLPRESSALWVLHNHLRGFRVLLVRYTRTEMVAIYRA